MSEPARATEGGIECQPEGQRNVHCALLTPGEAAQAIGCSRDFFDEHIGPELR